MRTFIMLAALFAATAACAHGLSHDVSRGDCVVVTLTHDDGEPFATETYDLSRPGETQPFQSGRTDALGRVVFVPDTGGDWRLRAFSEDGHGVDMTVAVAAPTADEAPELTADTMAVAVPAAAAPCPPSRAWRAVTGVSLLFGIFGVVMLFVKRR